MNSEIDRLVQSLKSANKIKLVHLKQWYCDHCGEKIDRAENGWLEWLRPRREDTEHGFRIVHHNERCMYNQTEFFHKGFATKDSHLAEFVGIEGLNRLLEISSNHNVDREEITEIIRRLHIPYYEQSLKLRAEAFNDNYFSDDPKFYCGVEDSLRIIERYEK